MRDAPPDLDDVWTFLLFALGILLIVLGLCSCTAPDVKVKVSGDHPSVSVQPPGEALGADTPGRDAWSWDALSTGEKVTTVSSGGVSLGMILWILFRGLSRKNEPVED